VSLNILTHCYGGFWIRAESLFNQTKTEAITQRSVLKIRMKFGLSQISGTASTEINIRARIDTSFGVMILEILIFDDV
jgi:hypothetical protein